ncbi:MAG: hypothetical protein R3C49_07120 [Planctomycetaceae bacterium]
MSTTPPNVTPSPPDSTTPNTTDPNATTPTPTPDQPQTQQQQQQQPDQNVQQQFNDLANQTQAPNINVDVAQSTGNAGAPNMIGDFLGLFTGTAASQQSIAAIPTTFGGSPLNGLSFSSSGSNTIDLFLPKTSTPETMNPLAEMSRFSWRT